MGWWYRPVLEFSLKQVEQYNLKWNVFVHPLKFVYHLLLNSLDDPEIGGDDDNDGEGEAKHVDVDDISNTLSMIITISHPLYSTAKIE